MDERKLSVAGLHHALLRSGNWFWMAAERLQVLLGVAEDPYEIDVIEDQVQGALPSVEPSADFRDSLRHNLELAAMHRTSGIALEYPRPYRGGIALGISAGVVAAVIAAVALIVHARRPARAE